MHTQAVLYDIIILINYKISETIFIYYLESLFYFYFINKVRPLLLNEIRINQPTPTKNIKIEENFSRVTPIKMN